MHPYKVACCRMRVSRLHARSTGGNGKGTQSREHEFHPEKARMAKRHEPQPSVSRLRIFSLALNAACTPPQAAGSDQALWACPPPQSASLLDQCEFRFCIHAHGIESQARQLQTDTSGFIRERSRCSDNGWFAHCRCGRFRWMVRVRSCSAV